MNTRRNSGSLPPPAASGISSTGAPANPFARTLATSEASFGLQRATESQQDSNRQDGEGQRRPDGGKPALDVDSFKNILMTGSAAPSPPQSTPAQRMPDSSSSTDTSSVSRQSIYDPMLEVHHETPRTSFDQFDSPSEDEDDDYCDDEEKSTLMTGPGRLDDLAPPAPPKPGRGQSPGPRGPQTVSFADFDETIPSGFTSSRQHTPPVQHNLVPNLKPPTLKRSPSDLNKPLPPPPEDSSKPAQPPAEVASQSSPPPPLQQEPISASTSTQEATQSKKAPPPPPTSRRAGQTANAPGRSRSASNVTQNSTQDDDGLPKPPETTSKTAAPPPPPPSRKTKPASDPSVSTAETPPQSSSPAPIAAEPKSMPPPPPRRNTSKIGNALHRTSSNASRSSVSRVEPSTRQNENAPPAPPPRRGKRDSMDGNRRSSGLSDQGGPLGPLSKIGADAEAVVSPSAESAASRDILADMSAFQAEIDALRARSQGG